MYNIIIKSKKKNFFLKKKKKKKKKFFFKKKKKKKKHAKNSDRSKPLNVGESIRACLIRLMTNTLLGNSRETISTLLYTLCDSNGKFFFLKKKKKIYNTKLK